MNDSTKHISAISGHLPDVIKRHFHGALSDEDAAGAASNLLSFMELLLEIDREHGTSANPNGARP